MLLGINPLLTGDILKALDEMGHSDSVVIADANFPAHRTNSRVFEVPGVGIAEMTEAVVSVLSLDGDRAPALMESNLSPRPAIQNQIIEATGQDRFQMVDRWEYYDLTKDAFAVISTGELALWANVILYKGLPYSHNS